MSRFPTFKRHLDDLVDTLTDDLAKKGNRKIERSKSRLGRLISWKSFKDRTTNGSDQEESVRVTRDIEIS